MVSFTIASAYIMATAIVISATIAQSSDFVPPCLSQCLAQTTQPCTTSSLPFLINCINTQCTPDDTSGTDTSVSSMALNYTPKVEYSCQQSFLLGSSEQAPSMQLTGDGKCMTSPYDFQSLFVSAAATTGDGDGAVTLQKMAQRCSMILYAGEGCEGDATKLDLSGAQGDKCIFSGGRSAKLTCSVLRTPDTSSYTSLIFNLCSGANAPVTGPNSTTPAANRTGSPYGGSGMNATSSIPDPKIPPPSSQPYTGRASGDQVAKPSLIALVALFAVAVALL